MPRTAGDRACGIAVLANVAGVRTTGVALAVTMPLSPRFCPRALERPASPYYDFDPARFARFVQPADRAAGRNDRTDRASRALPDQEWRKWMRSLL
jgi:hypothetical protein